MWCMRCSYVGTCFRKTAGSVSRAWRPKCLGRMVVPLLMTKIFLVSLGTRDSLVIGELGLLNGRRGECCGMIFQPLIQDCLLRRFADQAWTRGCTCIECPHCILLIPCRLLLPINGLNQHISVVWLFCRCCTLEAIQHSLSVSSTKAIQWLELSFLLSSVAVPNCTRLCRSHPNYSKPCLLGWPLVLQTRRGSGTRKKAAARRVPGKT